MQHMLNKSLLTLLHPLAQKAPTVNDHQLALVSSDTHIAGSGRRDKGSTMGLNSSIASDLITGNVTNLTNHLPFSYSEGRTDEDQASTSRAARKPLAALEELQGTGEHGEAHGGPQHMPHSSGLVHG